MVFSKKQKTGFLIALLFAAVVVWVFVFIEENKTLLEINFFDVGQGDAELIKTPDKKQILIDGGPDMSVLEKLGSAMPFYDRNIDLIILTHPEKDHLSGLIEVLKRYKVGAVITSGVFRDSKEYKEWIEILSAKRIPIFAARIGGMIDLRNGAYLKILYPFEDLVGKKFNESNNTSVVTQLVYGSFETLFTGDIEKSAEENLVNSGINLNSDILKIAHHGSKTSSGEKFLKAVNALVAVIEVGKDNQYGHPHQEVLERLKDVALFATGKDGDIRILSNGLGFEIKNKGSLISYP